MSHLYSAESSIAQRWYTYDDSDDDETAKESHQRIPSSHTVKKHKDSRHKLSKRRKEKALQPGLLDEEGIEASCIDGVAKTKKAKRKSSPKKYQETKATSEPSVEKIEAALKQKKKKKKPKVSTGTTDANKVKSQNEISTKKTTKKSKVSRLRMNAGVPGGFSADNTLRNSHDDSKSKVDTITTFETVEAVYSMQNDTSSKARRQTSSGQRLVAPVKRTDTETSSRTPYSSYSDLEEGKGSHAKDENLGFQICGRRLTHRQAKRLRFSCSHIGVFFAGLLVGALFWNWIDTQPTASTNEDFFSTPWIWPEGNLTVGAYYYPWYSDDFHRGAGYLREKLTPKQLPTLGEYDDTDPKIVYQHLKWSAQANLRLWVTSWWGPGSREDATTLDVILPHPALNDHKIALFYETTGRIKESEGYSIQNVVPDIVYMCQNYFEHPNYLLIDGKPVIFIYLTRKLEELGLLDEVISEMRQAARSQGHDIYIIGDHVFQHAPDVALLHPPFNILDAVTNYDVYGSMDKPSPYATEAGIGEHFRRSKKWQEAASQHNCAFIPSVSPGYNDLGVRPEKRHGPLSRQLSESDVPGSLFESALRYARRLVEKRTSNLIMVNSFNEWHEDTQIEPAKGSSTSLPQSMTNGIEYRGYGERYLNILREETTH